MPFKRQTILKCTRCFINLLFETLSIIAVIILPETPPLTQSSISSSPSATSLSGDSLGLSSCLLDRWISNTGFIIVSVAMVTPAMSLNLTQRCWKDKCNIFRHGVIYITHLITLVIKLKSNNCHTKSYYNISTQRNPGTEITDGRGQNFEVI